MDLSRLKAERDGQGKNGQTRCDQLRANGNSGPHPAHGDVTRGLAPLQRVALLRIERTDYQELGGFAENREMACFTFVLPHFGQVWPFSRSA
jgi:hypothetical protein